MSKYAFYVLVLFVFSLPWQDIIFLPGSSVLSISRLSGLLLIVAGLASTLRRGTVRLRTPPVTLVLTLLFAFWTLVASLWNPWSSAGNLLYISTYGQLAIMSVLFWQLCRTKEQHMTLMQAFVFGAYVVSGPIVYQYLTNPFVPNSEQNMARYVGLGGNANGVANMIALAIPMAWYLGSFWSKGLVRGLNYLYIPITIFAVILTGSRGGFLVALVGLLVIPFTFKYVRRSIRAAVVMLAVAAAVVVIPMIPTENFERIAETSSEISDGNVSNRSQIWGAGLVIYEQHPIFGIGTLSFPREVETVLGYSIPMHNAFLLVLVEFGIVGFILFAANFVIVLLPLLRLSGPDKMLYLCLWLALVISMLPSNDENAQHVWALLIFMATRRAYRLRLFADQPAVVGGSAPKPFPSA